MTERLPPTPERLTPEERALAARLARLGPHGEPSPALDARILAAARAALPASAPRRNPNRWPLAFGIAASVALAVGLAWQLRPLPEPVVYDEAASAVDVAADAPAADVPEMDAPEAEAPAADAIAAPDPMPTVATPAAPPAGDEAPAAFQRSAEPARRVAPKPGTSVTRDADAGSRQERARPAPPPSPVVPQEPPSTGVASEAAAAAADMALPPPPAAPTAPPPATATKAAPTKAAAPSPQAIAREAAARDASAAERARNATAASAAEARATQAAEDSFADEPFVEDVPPATADSPAVRDAWLHRIRELRASGDTDAARASLREFVRRYPAFPLPDDLRPLLD